MKIISAVLIICLASCNIKYYMTPEKGYRVENSKDLSFHNHRLRGVEITKIDTSSIYVFDGLPNYYRCARFFSGGQVLVFYSKDFPDIKMINNQDLGDPGYFIIKKNKIKLNLFSNNYGGVNTFFKGKILDDGNLQFEDNFGCYTKYKFENIIYYKPSW